VRSVTTPVDSPSPLKQNDAAMPIQYWILKTEPSVYSFGDLLEKDREVWDGITNPLALKYLRTAQAGDLALIYHTGDVKAAVGLARILGAPYPDPMQQKPAHVVVDIEPVRTLVTPVTLEAMKKNPLLKGLELLRIPRLSFVPVSREHWKVLMKMSGTKG
jgi:predicted RNA-binding protein with PUA-like domain